MPYIARYKGCKNMQCSPLFLLKITRFLDVDFNYGGFLPDVVFGIYYRLFCQYVY